MADSNKYKLEGKERNKQKVVYSEKLCELLYKEYSNKRHELNIIDNKVMQFILLNSALLAILVNFIKFPLDSKTSILFSVEICLIFVSLIFLLFQYIPKDFRIININAVKKCINKGVEAYKLFLDATANSCIDSCHDLKGIINQKDFTMKLTYFFYIIELIIFVILLI